MQKILEIVLFFWERTLFYDFFVRVLKKYANFAPNYITWKVQDGRFLREIARKNTYMII